MQHTYAVGNRSIIAEHVTARASQVCAVCKVGIAQGERFWHLDLLDSKGHKYGGLNGCDSCAATVAGLSEYCQE